MRVARLWHEGEALAALAHEGALYRVDLLDRALGSALPPGLLDGAGGFQRRVFSMALAGLEEHDFELRDGIEVEDCALTCPPARWLPPCGQDPALLELRPGASLPWRLDGRALWGHEVRARATGSSLLVRPCLGLVLQEDLHLPSPREVRRALAWLCLGLAWVDPTLAARAAAEGVGASPGRLPGTHLGPWIQPAEEGVFVLTLDRQRPGEGLACAIALELDRVALVVAQQAAHADLRAGDVVLLSSSLECPVEEGEWVSVSEPKLGVLRGRVG
jgi:hypothetical protein